MDMGEFSCMQCQQSSVHNRGRYNKLTRVDRTVMKIMHVQSTFMHADITPGSCGYENITATYVRRAEIPSPIYAKHQYGKNQSTEVQ